MATFVVRGNITAPAEKFDNRVKFSIAENISYEKDGEKIEKSPNFFDIVCFNSNLFSEIDALTSKDFISVMGNLNTSTYEKDGQKRKGFDFVATKIEKIQRKEGE